MLQAIKEIKKTSQSQFNPFHHACLSTSNNSVALEDVNNNSGEIANTNDKILIPKKVNINDNDTFKKSKNNQLKEVIKREKGKIL